jgi:hypothetical protein
MQENHFRAASLDATEPALQRFAGEPPRDRSRVMRRLRTRSVGTKLTDEEYAMLVAACPEPTLSEWIRRVLLSAARAQHVEHLILAELLALRAIVVTLHFSIASGEKLTSETLHHLMELADREKFLKAMERLATAPDRSR